jgi:phage host-nuclease inhibitor protein Gam
MAKRLKETDLTLEEIRRASDVALAFISDCVRLLEALDDEAGRSMQAVTAKYAALREPLWAKLEARVAWLKDTMKNNKAVLFDGTDLVDLPHGTLIRNVADRVTIPRDAPARCEELGFADAIRIAKRLDREAVGKWPDERLFLIGAERRVREEFSYDLKEEATP